ncbi:MAG: ATP-binding protein [Pseudomonadota bacterium]
MTATPLFGRHAAKLLTESLVDSPVVLIHGPRQCGKTTLAQMVCGPMGYAYSSFDDEVTRAAAEADPVGFVLDLPERVILDEVQRVPGIFSTLKLAVDRRRTPGRFVLTGSTSVLLVPGLADSLAGRMQVVRLHPLSRCELARREPTFLHRLLGGHFKAGGFERLGRGLSELVADGGFPAALARATGRRRAAWYRDYLDALVQRDVRDFSRISSLDALPRLLGLAAAQTACLLNISKLAAPFQLSRPTIRDYVTLLERLFLIQSLPPWHSNRASRLVKTPKLHLGDTGLACALLGADAAALQADRKLLGQLLETFVLQELQRQASGLDESLSFLHFRDKDGVEVDIVLENGTRTLVGVEVKASATVTAADFHGLRRLRQAAGARFRTGVVIYDGESCVSFGDGLWAVPVRALWDVD